MVFSYPMPKQGYIMYEVAFPPFKGWLLIRKDLPTVMLLIPYRNRLIVHLTSDNYFRHPKCTHLLPHMPRRTNQLPHYSMNDY
jgi:hypothetical protein